jgi:uncharacterized delta-60 repeat protein
VAALPDDGPTSVSGEAVTILPDSRLVVSGTTVVGTYPDDEATFAVARFEPNGGLDASFGTGGFLSAADLAGERETVLLDAALHPDGLVAVGTLSPSRGIAVARFDVDEVGEVDAAFGESGLVSLAGFRPGPDFAQAAALRPDGRLVVAGAAGTASRSALALYGFEADGTPDALFGDGGALLVRYGAPGENSTEFGAYAVAATEDALVVAGRALDPVYEGDAGGLAGSDFLAARLLPDGSPDPAFGEGGLVTTDLGGDDRPRAVLALPDGGVLVAGYTREASDTLGETDAVLVRYDADGALDDTFGEGGIVVLDAGRFDEVQDAALLPDGSVLVAGTRTPGASETTRAFVARYDASGTLDSAFGEGGVALIEPPAGGTKTRCYALALLPDGRIVVGGRIDFRGGLFALSPGGTLEWAREGVASSRTVDVDAEGRIVAAGSGQGRVVTARYGTDGTLDETYGDGGLTDDDLGYYSQLALNVIAHPSGRVVVVGTVPAPAFEDGEAGTHADIALAAYRADGTVDAEPTADTAPEGLTVWPNPTAGTATVALVLDRPHEVKVEVWDVLGRRIAVLHDGPLTAGEHRLTLSGTALTAGVYVVRATGRGLDLTHQVTLVR